MEFSEIMASISRDLKGDRKFDPVKVEYRHEGEPRMCYNNSAEFVISNRSYSYVLGILWFRNIPMEHAWVVSDKGVHIDVTLKGDNAGEQLHYPILTIPSDDILEIVCRGEPPPSFYSVWRERLKK